MKSLGYGSDQEAIGKTIKMRNKDWDIIGVIKDFHQKSLHYAIEPVILQPFYGTYNPISVKMNTKDLASTIAAVCSYRAAIPASPAAAAV